MEQLRMNLGQYYENPYGKGSTFANANAIKANLLDRYTILRENSKFKHKTYILNKDTDYEKYYILVEVPSESIDMEYQVVLELTKPEESSNMKSIEKCNVRFFCNSPSFIYTHAYVYNIFGMFMTELSDKYDPKVLRQEPNIRNFHKILGYEKTIFYATTYLINNYNEISKIRQNSIDIETIDEIDNLILSETEILFKYKAKQKVKKEKIKKDPRYALMHKIKKEVQRNEKKKKEATTNPNKIVAGANKNIDSHRIEKKTSKSKIRARKKIK